MGHRYKNAIAAFSLIFLLSLFSSCSSIVNSSLEPDSASIQSPHTEPQEFKKEVELDILQGFPSRARLTGGESDLGTVNSKIEEALSVLYSAVSLFQTEAQAPVLTYGLTGKTPQLQLAVNIMSASKVELFNLSYSIHTDTGQVNLQPNPLVDFYSDSQMLYKLLYLKTKGLDIPLHGHIPVTTGTWVDILVGMYESLSGEEIDVAGIIDKGTLSQRKALQLDLLTPTELVYGASESLLEMHTVVAKSEKFYRRVSRSLFGKAAQQATVGDAQRILKHLGALLSPDLMSDDILEKSALWAEPSRPLTRLDFARLFVTVEESYTGREIVYKYEGWQPFTDTSDIYAEKASKYFYRNQDNAFGPDEILMIQDIYTPTADMMTNILMQQTGEGWGSLTIREVIDMAYSLLIALENETRQPIHEKIVLNERPYPWYVNQYETGEFGYVNCMPASMEMVMRWRDKDRFVSTEELRREYPCDGAGWYDVGLTNSMERHDVPYTLEWDLSADSMAKHLDEGNVLLVMYRGRNLSEGHAVVVKGYKSSEAGMWFICNDPASVTENKYGVPDGIDREKEARELIAEIKGHALWYLVIPPVQQDLTAAP